MKKITIILFVAVLGIGLSANISQAGPRCTPGYHSAGITVGHISVIGVPPLLFPPPPPFIHGSVRHHRYACDCGYYGHQRRHDHKYYRGHDRYHRRHHLRHGDRGRDHHPNGRGHRRH